MGNTINYIGRFFSSFTSHPMNTLPEIDRLYAFFCFQAYESSPIESYKGYNLKTNLSYIKVYVNDETKNVIIAFRGTDIDISKGNYEDIKVDLQLILGNLTKSFRFQLSKTAVVQFMRNYPTYKIHLCGHSLGGSTIYSIASKYPNIIGASFNPGIDLNALRISRDVSRRIKTNITFGDPVSGILGRLLPNTTIYKPNNFEEIMRLPPLKRYYTLHSMELYPRG